MVPDHTYVTRSTHINLSHNPHEVKIGSYTQKKSWHPKTDWPAVILVTSFFLPHDSLGVVERGFGQVVTQLYRLTGPIYQHTIGMFNTCSQGSTHRPLIDTGRGYNPRGVSFPQLTPWPSQPTVLHFPPKRPAQSQLIQSQHKPLVKVIWDLLPTCGLLTTRRLLKSISMPSNG
jgi:hypothetical protein